MNAAGATFGDGAMLAGRDINRGTATVSGGTVYGSVVGNNPGTINHTSGSAVAPSTYQLQISRAPTLQAGQENEVVVTVTGIQSPKQYRIEVRAPNIQVTETVHGAEAVLYIKPRFAGTLNLRVALYEGSNPTPLAQTMSQVQVVKE